MFFNHRSIYRLRLMPPTPLRRVPSFSELFQSLGTIYICCGVGKGTPHTHRQTDRQIVCGMIRPIFESCLASVRHELVINSDPSWGMLGSIWGDFSKTFGPSGAQKAVYSPTWTQDGAQDAPKRTKRHQDAPKTPPRRHLRPS